MKYSIELYGISKVINNKTILNSIGFKIKENTVFGIVGPNGSGKTSLLRIITGLYFSSKGFIRINESISDFSSMIESPKFYEDLTGRQNLKLMNILYNKNIDIDNIIKKFELNNYIDNKVKTYSLGMKQKLGISTLFLNNPKILILDEPTNGFDPGEIIKFKDLINRLENTTIVICTHDLDLIDSLCDEVLFIKNGRMIEIKKSPFESREKLEELFKEKKHEKLS